MEEIELRERSCLWAVGCLSSASGRKGESATSIEEKSPKLFKKLGVVRGEEAGEAVEMQEIFKFEKEFKNFPSGPLAEARESVSTSLFG